jgi:hypothetical protein
MYEQPSLHLELAKQRHADFMREAERLRLASQVEPGPSETVSIVKSIIAGLKGLVARRRPVVVHEPQLQGSV